MDELGNAQKQEVGRWLNNRCENSYLPVRRRERAMLRFRRMAISLSGSGFDKSPNDGSFERRLRLRP